MSCVELLYFHRFFFPARRLSPFLSAHPFSLPLTLSLCMSHVNSLAPSSHICNEALSGPCSTNTHKQEITSTCWVPAKALISGHALALSSRICLEQVSRANQRCTSKGAKTRLQGRALGHELVCLLLLTVLTLALCIWR
jgi:hypothetical protein